jgi:hypothetical protein
MEDFIIILIGFAVMIYSAYSKNKKAKEQQRKSAAETEGDFEDYGNENTNQEHDILEQFFGYETAEKTQHPFESSTAATDSHKNQKFSDDQNSGITQISDKEKTPGIRNIKEGGQLREEGITATKQAHYKKSARRKRNAQRKKAFNLRNAVIYSEILNRKY